MNTFLQECSNISSALDDFIDKFEKELIDNNLYFKLNAISGELYDISHSEELLEEFNDKNYWLNKINKEFRKNYKMKDKSPEAVRSTYFRLLNDKNKKIEQDKAIEEVELAKQEYERTHPVCPECGAYLDTVDKCPVCDYGEEDYFTESLNYDFHVTFTDVPATLFSSKYAEDSWDESEISVDVDFGISKGEADEFLMEILWDPSNMTEEEFLASIEGKEEDLIYQHIDEAREYWNDAIESEAQEQADEMSYEEYFEPDWDMMSGGHDDYDESLDNSIAKDAGYKTDIKNITYSADDEFFCDDCKEFKEELKTVEPDVCECGTKLVTINGIKQCPKCSKNNDNKKAINNLEEVNDSVIVPDFEASDL